MRKPQFFKPNDLVYIHNGKKLAVIGEREVFWTNNVRKATVVTYDGAQAIMRDKGYEGLWYEIAHPFNAVIRLKRGEQVFYIEKQTRSGFWLVRTMREAYHYKDLESAENVLRKWRKAIEERGYTPETVLDEALLTPEKRV